MRKNLGYTQQQVADSLSINRSTYAYYESGKIKPDIKTIINLAKIFSVNYTDILESENENRLSDSPYIRGRKGENMNSSESINFSNINNLTKKEQDIVMLFRLLSGNLQDEVLKLLLQSLKNE